MYIWTAPSTFWETAQQTVKQVGLMNVLCNEVSITAATTIRTNGQLCYQTFDNNGQTGQRNSTPIPFLEKATPSDKCWDKSLEEFMQYGLHLSCGQMVVCGTVNPTSFINTKYFLASVYFPCSFPWKVSPTSRPITFNYFEIIVLFKKAAYNNIFYILLRNQSMKLQYFGTGQMNTAFSCTEAPYKGFHSTCSALKPDLWHQKQLY